MEHLALIIAIIQGHESIHTSGINPKVYDLLYTKANNLYLRGWIAVKQGNSYTLEKHKEKWTRKGVYNT